MLSEIVKVVDGGGGDLKCCRPENFLVCRKNSPLLSRPVGKLSMLSENFKVVDGGGGGGF